MSAILTRETQPSDFLAIFEMLEREKLAGGYFTKARFQKMLTKNRGLFLVAESDGKVIGTIFASHDGGYFGYIYKVAVSPEHRGKGVGPALIRRVLEKLEQEDIYRCFAWIQPENEASLSLFAKFGIVPQTGLVCSKKL